MRSFRRWVESRLLDRSDEHSETHGAHFVDDYVRHVKRLKDRHPLDKAMSLAVGGHYTEFGSMLADMLVAAGLKTGDVAIDMGCGSGRVAHALAERVDITYLGIDVVPDLLEYAATKCPPSYRFVTHRELSIPARNQTADFIFAISLFTHLQHHETYIYLRDAFRVLKPGGIMLFSFHEFAMPAHWSPFEISVKAAAKNTPMHLNAFIERSAIEVWAARIGFDIQQFQTPSGPPHDTGQSVVILRKPS